MGAKDWFICYSEGDPSGVLAERPQLDREESEALVRRLFPGHSISPVEDGTLGDNPNPDDDLVYAAVWPRASIMCTIAVALDRPSELDRRFLDEGRGRRVSVHAMHSVVDWFAFGIWSPDGALLRALSVSGESGEVVENIGAPLDFEAPYWAGQFPATEDEDDEYPFPFHPLELGEATLGNLFGFVFEGYPGMSGDDSVDPFDIKLAGFRIVKQASRRRLFGRR